MQVKVQPAQPEWSELLDAVERGEEVVLARGDTPVAKVVPWKRGFVFDVFADKLRGPIPDFFEPMSEEDLALWEGRGEE